MNERIISVNQLGSLIKAKRKSIGLRQFDVQKKIGSGSRLISEIENGKETAQIGKVLQILDELGLSLFLSEQKKNYGRVFKAINFEIEDKDHVDGF